MRAAPTGASRPIPGPAAPATAAPRRRQPGHPPNIDGHGYYDSHAHLDRDRHARHYPNRNALAGEHGYLDYDGDTDAYVPAPTDVATQTATQTLTPSPTPSVTPVKANPGDVVINEIMQNPKALADEKGEWFEVHNPTNHAIDLNGWTIKDAGSEHHRISNGEPLRLPAGGYLVLGRNADSSSNGGVLIAYRYAGFTLGNTDDEIILLDGAGTEIDRVAYDGGLSFPDPDGASMQLIRPDLDNSSGANWRISSDPWPGSAGDHGSPGTPNHTARIEGYVYEDRNGNRAREADEPGIADVVVSLSNGRTTRSIASGWYGFADLAPGHLRGQRDTAGWLHQHHPGSPDRDRGAGLIGLRPQLR